MTSKREHANGDGGKLINGDGRDEKEMSSRDTPERGGEGGMWYSTT